MKKVMSMFAILVMIGVLCAGCKDKKAEATQQSQESNAKVCASETSKQSTTNSTQCQHSQKTNGADKPKPETTQQSQESNTKGWEPETSKQSTTNSTQGGHDHSAGDHSGHNH